MDTAKAKLLFDEGGLKSVKLLRSPLGEGWTIEIETIKGKSHTMTKARSKTIRVIKGLDPALKAIEEIGFRVEGLEIIKG